jgi:integrase
MLAPADISVDSRENPSYLTVLLRQSKTDQFGNGVTVHLHRIDDVLCPVAAVLAYLAIRPPEPGPLFLFRDGSTLSRPRLVSTLREALLAAGINSSLYNGHCFRIGAATTAADAGIGDAVIMQLGRWRSQAYTAYVREAAHPRSLARLLAGQDM